ncbi:MAG TPA: hypothetical protein VFQ61_25225, partial [Polyangiaceae bacterium]|nr:hypothetical protein [Polyangiaceae bacterium]
NPVIACTTGNAHPFILKTKPKAAPAPVPTPAPPPADDERHGQLRPRSPERARAPQPATPEKRRAVGGKHAPPARGELALSP